MKKKSFARKLVLQKKTIVNLTAEDLKAFRAGAVGTGIGPSCFTDSCCKTNECEESQLLLIK
jgi:hypothetical protein